jgi:hypothetical protein
MLFANLSTQERKLYSLIGMALVIALVIGALSGLIGFIGKSGERADNWQPSSLADPIDTLVQFTLVSTPSRWYQDPVLASAQAKAEEQKSLEGQPDSFRLLGIVERGDKRVALFMPIAGLKTPSARKVSALSQGDVLVGNWKVKELTSSKVVLIAEKEGIEAQMKEILLYVTQKP